MTTPPHHRLALLKRERNAQGLICNGKCYRLLGNLLATTCGQPRGLAPTARNDVPRKVCATTIPLATNRQYEVPRHATKLRAAPA